MLCADPGLLLISRVAIFITSKFKTIDCAVAFSAVMPMLLPNAGFSESLSLPPGLRLHSVREPACSVLERDTAHQATETVGPIRVGHKQPQNGSAEKFAAGSDLRRDGEFAQPAVELSVAVCRSDEAFGMVKPGLERQRKVLVEENF